MKEKCRYISKAEFRRLVAEERKVARAHGFELKMYYRPMSWNLVKDYGMFAKINGDFCSDEKVIRVSITGRPGRGRILAVLYHEMRHLEHHIQGLYPDYYRITPFTTKDLYRDKDPCVPKGFSMPCLKIALAAERDCNKAAELKLKELNVKVKIKEYLYNETLSYRILSRVYSILLDKEIEVKTASPKREVLLRKQIHNIYNSLLEGGYPLKKEIVISNGIITENVWQEV